MENLLSFSSGEFPLRVECNQGVYALSDVNTGYAYIGSSTNLERREKEQFSALKSERHYNEFVQTAYDLLGSARIKFVVLESASNAEELVQKEQRWIRELAANGSALNICLVVPKNRPGGHKLSRETRRRQSRAKKGIRIPVEKTRARRYRFRSPSGEVVEILGLRAFAAEHGLNISHLSKLARGKLRTHRGFTRVSE
jgi:group I intron endonuclease